MNSIDTPHSLQMNYSSFQVTEKGCKGNNVEESYNFDDSCTDTGSGSSSDEDFFDSVTSNLSTGITSFASTSNLQHCISQQASHESTGNGLYLSLEMVKLLRKSSSDGNLQSLIPQSLIDSMEPPTPKQQSGTCKALPHSKGITSKHSSIVFAIQDRKRKVKSTNVNHENNEYRSPKDVISEILKTQEGIEIESKSYNDSILENYFVKGTTNCHSLDATQLLMRAVRDNDLKTIKELHEVLDCNLQCCNKFQESIVHTVARRGYMEILEYLYIVADISLRVCCDGGRNALHDACWTSQPNFHLIKLFIEDSPDLLYIKDKRNNTPLDYIPKEAYGVWNKWLTANSTLLKPTVLPYLVAIH